MQSLSGTEASWRRHYRRIGHRLPGAMTSQVIDAVIAQVDSDGTRSRSSARPITYGATSDAVRPDARSHQPVLPRLGRGQTSLVRVELGPQLQHVAVPDDPPGQSRAALRGL